MSTNAEAALASAWIAARDDLDDWARIDAVRVAADRLQAEGHPLGELVTLGLALLEHQDSSVRASLRAAYLERVAALLPEALGPFSTLATHPQAFDMRWSLCYLEGARLPIARAHLYAGLLGVSRLDPPRMVAMFLEQPAARCLRSLTLDLGQEQQHYPQVLEAVAQCRAPIETLVVWSSVPDQPAPPERMLAMPHLHTLVLRGETVELPGGDADVPWTGDASSIRALGRALSGRNFAAVERALARVRRMGRNSARYLSAMQALEPRAERHVRIDAHALRSYAEEASSLERQGAQLEVHGMHPRWALLSRWRVLVPSGAWFGTDALETVLREHNRLHDSPSLEPLSLEQMREDPSWVEFRRQAEEILRLLDERPR